jgi:cytochrome c6
MKKILFIFSAIAATIFVVSGTFAQQPAAKNVGEAKFKDHCAVCHPNGGNIINQKKALFKAGREANNIKTADDIIKNMRNPGPGMSKFDEKTLSDAEARAIAEYILKTF